MADLTRAEALRLFIGYPNYSQPVARKFVDLFFSTISPTGDLDVVEPAKLRFYNLNRGVLLSWMGSNSLTTYWNTNAAGHNLQMFAHNIASVGGAVSTTIARDGGTLGFFSDTGAAKQTIAIDSFAAPTDLATCITQITKLQSVVSSIRTALLNYNLADLP